VAVGIGGTLGVQAVADESGSTSSVSDQRAIDRAYKRCLKDLAGGRYFFDEPSSAERAVCRREARDPVLR
jgi:hypothetical protein